MLMNSFAEMLVCDDECGTPRRLRVFAPNQIDLTGPIESIETGPEGAVIFEDASGHTLGWVPPGERITDLKSIDRRVCRIYVIRLTSAQHRAAA